MIQRLNEWLESLRTDKDKLVDMLVNHLTECPGPWQVRGNRFSCTINGVLYEIDEDWEPFVSTVSFHVDRVAVHVNRVAVELSWWQGRRLRRACKRMINAWVKRHETEAVQKALGK